MKEVLQGIYIYIYTLKDCGRGRENSTLLMFNKAYKIDAHVEITVICNGVETSNHMINPICALCSIAGP